MDKWKVKGYHMVGTYMRRCLIQHNLSLFYEFPPRIISIMTRNSPITHITFNHTIITTMIERDFFTHFFFGLRKKFVEGGHL